jgi:CxxC-x17-CxxC domain-containing protein
MKNNTPNRKMSNTKKGTSKLTIEDLSNAINERLDIIENKLDSILLKSTVAKKVATLEYDPGFKTRSSTTKKPFKEQEHAPRERKMHKAVCAECKIDCEVPFEPRQGSPVYCKECHLKRKNARKSNNIVPKVMPEIIPFLKEVVKINSPEKSKKIKPVRKTTAAKNPTTPKGSKAPSKKAAGNKKATPAKRATLAKKPAPAKKPVPKNKPVSKKSPVKKKRK